jgi:DnaK suppressor protein
MPSKKPNKVAKKPGKAIPKKATPKAAVFKTPTRMPTKPNPKPAATKVTVKSNKPNPKSAAAKTAAVKAPHPKPTPPPPAKPALSAKSAAPPKSAPPAKPLAAAKPETKPEPGKAAAAERAAPVKFDIRPLVLQRALANDDDADPEAPTSASLLAGPRNVKPYITRRGEQYMNKEQLEHFARILQNWKRDLMVEVDRTVLHMKDEAANFPDPNDRATQEEEFSLELRTRDRERKLIRKIDEALKRIEDGSYGYCLETGEEIGIKRLEARPVATLSVEAQERRERREKQYGDRDDRYR